MHEQLLCCRRVTCIYIRVSWLCCDCHADILPGYSLTLTLCGEGVVNISKDLQVQNLNRKQSFSSQRATQSLRAPN